MKEQWKQGLQWGAVAAVAWWIAARVMWPIWWLGGESENWRVVEAIRALVTVPVFGVIVLTWSKYSRVVMLGIVAYVFSQSSLEPLGAPSTASYTAARFLAQHVDGLKGSSGRRPMRCAGAWIPGSTSTLCSGSCS